MSSDPRAAKIDSLCDQFEAELVDEKDPQVGDFLDHVAEEDRADLFRELVALELELLSDSEFQAKLTVYRKNYPEYKSLLLEIEQAGEIVAKRSSSLPRRNIGPYKILRVIGEGGMGSVYMAEQAKPLRRRVAIKVIRAGANSRQVIARFEAERQALAMMEHPSIARILDAGTTDSGEPFFAMELVKGDSLSTYCDRHRLNVSQRLKIFLDVCDAVQHAHQKGIIHRDLKPGNILVGEYDGKPVVKIIDFGLAKALEVSSRLTERTLYTEYGQVVGTVNYMSPEQAGLDALDIDTRSDIYTLGVILYELLTGTTPLDSESLRDLALFKVLELIREHDTVRPSMRVTTKKYGLEKVTKLRSMEPKQFLKVLSGDLDWIVVKALEKERNRRYQTASELSKDILNYLSDEPVIARPPSKGYLLTKFIRRHKVLASSIVATGMILLVASAICIALIVNLNERQIEALAANKALSEANLQIEAERDRAESLLETTEIQRREAEKQQAIADEQRIKAQEQEKLATTVLDFLQTNLLRQASVYEQANDGDPSFVDAKLTLLEALQKSAREFSPQNIEAKFPGQPETQANILETMAEIFSVVNEHKTSIEFSTGAEKIRMKDVEGEIPGEVLANRVYRVFFYLNADRHADAAVTATSVFKETHAILERAEGRTLTEKQNRDVDEKIDLVVDAIASRLSPKFIRLPQLEIEKLNPIDYARIISAVTESIYYLPKLHDLMAKRFEPNDDRAKYALLMTGFVDHFAAEVQGKIPIPGLTAAGSLDRAIETYEEIHKFCEDTLTAEDLRIAGIKMILAVAYRDKFGSSDDRVLKCYQDAAEICHLQLPIDHPANILVDSHVANYLTYKDRYKEAVELYRTVAERSKRVYGTAEFNTIQAILNLADCYREIAIRESSDDAKVQPLDEAIKYYQEAYQLQNTEQGTIDENTAYAAEELAKTYRIRNHLPKAIEYFQAAWNYREKHLDEDFDRSIQTLSHLCSALNSSGDRARAIKSLEKLVSLRSRRRSAVEDPLLRFGQWRLAKSYAAEGETAKADELLKLLGQSEIYPFTIVVDETVLSNPSEVRDELYLLPHTVTDIEIDVRKNKCHLKIVYEYTEKPDVKYTWYRSSVASQFAALESDLKRRSFTLVKKIPYQIKDKPFIAHLWHSQVSSDDL